MAKIKISPCFWCGAASSVRTKGPERKEFNACLPHESHLITHAQTLFHTAFSMHYKEGTSLRYHYDLNSEDWKIKS